MAKKKGGASTMKPGTCRVIKTPSGTRRLKKMPNGKVKFVKSC